MLRYHYLFIWSIFSIGSNCYADDMANFDSSFLIGDAQSIDLSRFKYGNPVLAGHYNLDVYINGNWFGKRNIYFAESSKNAVACFTRTELLEYGIKSDILSDKPTTCQAINLWVKDASYDFDSSKLRLDISVPQSAMNQIARDYVDPKLWDRGINAGFLSYSGSVYHTSNNDKDDTHAFMSLSTGVNLAGWQLRHTGQWQSEHYQETTTYIQRPLPQYRGVLTIGNNFTSGELFDSFRFRGIDFSSDDQMLPSSMLGYAPQIRGNAKTNAKVEIRQQGQLIYQTTVAPGAFNINDLYPTGFGGALDVSVIEANGEIQTFSVPYASVVQMLRPGLSRYSVTAGQFNDTNIGLTPWVTQAKYQRGLNNYITGYTGLQISDHYLAMMVGAAFSTPIGAVALDATHSKASFDNQETRSGQSFKISYSKLISPTNTNLTLAAYRYSTENYYNLRDAILVRELDQAHTNSFNVGKQKSDFQITMNQGLPIGWGNLYLTGSWSNYWNQQQSSKQFQFGYSNNYRNFTYGLSATQRRIISPSQASQKDTEYLLTLSFPLDFKYPTDVNLSTSNDSQTAGINGVINERLNYGASITRQNDNNSFNLNSRYKTNYATVGGSYSQSQDYKQEMLSLTGNIVAHSHGILFGADQGQTMVLVYAPNATGAKVSNTNGLSINKAGYAVIPYVTPYRFNDINLDPQDMSSNVELEETSQRIAPFSGAIAKVDFSTKSGYAIYIESEQNLPFGAQVYNLNNEPLGMVAQGNLVYIRSQKLQDTIIVKWGSSPDQQCKINYQATQNTNNIYMIKGKCQ